VLFRRAARESHSSQRLTLQAFACSLGRALGIDHQMMSTDVVAALAVTAPGLAHYASQELRAQGIAPHHVGVEGASFETSLAGVYTANLWLRTASRVVIRLSTFVAESFHELERRARGVAWSRYVTAATPVRLRVTCRKSRLYHSDAVAERIAGAITRAGGVVVGGRTGADSAQGVDDDLSGAAPEQLVVVRLFRDRCTISLDSSGAMLHKRGYRLETAKAPVRETLAAAVLMAAGWSADRPLVDPFCGAGTFAIEAAWLARNRAPGLGRPFAFMHWPGFDHSVWEGLVASARSAERSGQSLVIQASDRDAGAVAATRHNADRAGVIGDVEIEQRSLSDIHPRQGPGWVVTNPPYGVRVAGNDRLQALYSQMGDVLRAKCGGWTVALLSADRTLTRLTGLPFVTRLRTVNGGIPVDVLAATVR
jgi:putative N6-adenine-specific DNA methylase